MDSYEELWEAVKEECKSLVTESIYNVWFKDMELVRFDDEKVVISLCEFKRKIVVKKFLDKLKTAFVNVMGFEPGSIELLSTEEKNEEVIAEPETFIDNEDTFESFIVGPSNRFAYAAASSVANEPGEKYNPLFIYGNSGLGKTHLLNAICHRARLNNPSANIIYTRGEDFTNEMIRYINYKNTEEFHNKYRNADILLVDDIQFIAGKDSTQDEFFHTFDAVYRAGKQIVLTSDRPPKAIGLLEERLKTRFEWGLIADIQAPDLETRVAIIKKKAKKINLKIPDDVAMYIAENLKNNIRQLEHAVQRLHAFNNMQNLDVNIATAKKAIEDIVVDEGPSPVTAEKIVSEVARTFGVDEKIIYSKQQTAEITRMRQMAMYVIRELTDMSTKAIGNTFGRDHSTVVYSLEKFKKIYEKDKNVQLLVSEIIKNVQEG